MDAERIHHKAGDFLVHRHEHLGVSKRQPWSFALEHFLSLFIDLGALRRIGRRLALEQQVLEFLVAPDGVVGLADGIAAKQEQEVVRIAIVACPAKLEGAITILGLAAFAILGPFVADDFRLRAVRSDCTDG